MTECIYKQHGFLTSKSSYNKDYVIVGTLYPDWSHYRITSLLECFKRDNTKLSYELIEKYLEDSKRIQGDYITHIMCWCKFYR